MFEKLPLWFRAIGIGLIVTGVPTTAWAVVATLNFKFTPAVPWSVPLMAIALWAYWRLTGRSEYRRANPLRPETAELALIAGGSGVIAVWAAFAALRGMMHIAPQASDAARFPIASVLAAILMGSAVAGICEEIGFRGFMQLRLERAYGPAAAVLTTSVVFTLAHLTHGSAILPFLPFYFAVSVIYGVLTLLTGSVLPSMTLHFAGDALMLTLQFLGARAGAPPSMPGAFALAPVILAIAAGSVSAMAFRSLAPRGISAAAH